MSVTVFVQRRNGAIRWQPGKRWLLLPLLMVITGSYVYQHSVEQLQLQQDRADSALSARVQHKNQIQRLKSDTESQIGALAARVASMQAKVARLEALGQHVAAKNKLDEKFDFSSEVGIGGGVDIGADVELSMLLEEMELLLSRIDNNNVQLPLLETITSNLHIDKERFISGRPILKGWLSSDYGIRTDPFTGRKTMHKGVDFAGKEGGDVIATAAGLVTFSGHMFGYGGLVEIDHGNGLKTRYGHNKSMTVNVGDVVAKGDRIALIGSTGRSTGPHVHYEVLSDGQQINPRKYVYRKAG